MVGATSSGSPPQRAIYGSGFSRDNHTGGLPKEFALQGPVKRDNKRSNKSIYRLPAILFNVCWSAFIVKRKYGPCAV